MTYLLAPPPFASFPARSSRAEMKFLPRVVVLFFIIFVVQITALPTPEVGKRDGKRLPFPSAPYRPPETETHDQTLAIQHILTTKSIPTKL